MVWEEIGHDDTRADFRERAGRKFCDFAQSATDCMSLDMNILLMLLKFLEKLHLITAHHRATCM